MSVRLPFAKLSPGGNTTILLTDVRMPPTELARISELLMHPLHLNAEQVGSLLFSCDTPHLQMMGGEFCVNATRSAALLLARAGRLSPSAQGCARAELTVSGASSSVTVLAGPDPQAVQQAIAAFNAEPPVGEFLPPFAFSRLCCAARMQCGQGTTRLLPAGHGATLVHMPGISHLLLDAAAHPMPENWRAAAASWRKQAALDTAPASGVVWFERTETGGRIQPAVEVRATRSEHLETACGSASLAFCLMLLQEGGSSKRSGNPCEVVQPSGESLFVLPERANGHDSNIPAQAWVFGSVDLVAEGEAYVDAQE